MGTKVDVFYSLWWAALELVRAQDSVREMAAAGRMTQADTDRLHTANDRWTQVRAAAGR